MTPGLVSVILTTYDRPDYLSQAVESVFSQTYPHIELIIVDDGSADDGASTKAVLEPYLSPNHPTDLPKITYIYQENSGLSTAINHGLTFAKGEYLQRLDDDDRLLPEKIARCVEFLHGHPEIGLVATNQHIIDAEGKRTHIQKANPCPNPARLLNMLMRIISFPPAIMVRSSVQKRVGPYRNCMAQDYEMWLRISKDYEIGTIDEPLVEYRRHPQQSTQSKLAKLNRDILHFVREYIQTTPIEQLVPNLQSKPHAYALRAAIYVLKDSESVRTTAFAKKELEQALQLSPHDPLLSLWKGVLAVHGDESLTPLPWEEALPAEYQAKAEQFFLFLCERKQLSAKKLNASTPEMVSFRIRFPELRSALIRDTYRKATGKAN